MQILYGIGLFATVWLFATLGNLAWSWAVYYIVVGDLEAEPPSASKICNRMFWFVLGGIFVYYAYKNGFLVL